MGSNQTKTQLNMWLYEEDAAAIRAKAAREDMPIGEYITRMVLGRDPAHPPSLEDRVERLERLGVQNDSLRQEVAYLQSQAMSRGVVPDESFDAEAFERFRTDPKNQAIVERILADDEAC